MLACSVFRMVCVCVFFLSFQSSHTHIFIHAYSHTFIFSYHVLYVLCLLSHIFSRFSHMFTNIYQYIFLSFISLLSFIFLVVSLSLRVLVSLFVFLFVFLIFLFVCRYLLLGFGIFLLIFYLSCYNNLHSCLFVNYCMFFYSS